MLSKQVFVLEEEAKKLEKSLCDTPPESYAKFMELVGKRNGLLMARDKIIEMSKEQDEYY